MATQLDIFEAEVQQKTETKHRIVVIDGHIIAQFEAGKTGWWTCYKGQSNTEADYALWEESEVNMRRAMKLVGEDAPVVRSDLAPVQARGGWLARPDDREVQPNTPEGYRMTLRALARSVESPLDPLAAFNQGKRVSVMVDGIVRRIVSMNLITQGATLKKSWYLILEDGRQLYAPVDANNAFFVE